MKLQLFAAVSSKVSLNGRRRDAVGRAGPAPKAPGVPAALAPVASPPAAYLRAAYSAWATACLRSSNAQRASLPRDEDRS
jgi:invasion protein IalB